MPTHINAQFKQNVELTHVRHSLSSLYCVYRDSNKGATFIFAITLAKVDQF